MSRVCKAFAAAINSEIEDELAQIFPQRGFFGNLFGKSPRATVFKTVYQALHPKPLTPQKLPPLALRMQTTTNFQLVFYKDHLKFYTRTFFGGWQYDRIIKSDNLNHFICANKYIVNYDSIRIVALQLSNNYPLLIPYDKSFPILHSENAFSYVAKNQTVVFYNLKLTPLRQVGFNFLHETETYLYLISSKFIVHLNVKNLEQTEEMIEVPKVISAKDNLLICETAIIQLSYPKSHILYKK